MYTRLMSTHGIKNVLVEQAEDETAIMKYFTYDQRQDIMVGSCGPKGADHVCQDSFVYKVGESYEDLVDFFRDNVLSSYARVIMFNPLHIHLPTTVIFLGCTCNSFDSKYVAKQWKKCQQIFADHFYEIFKAPLIGQASDGDSRRRKCMKKNGGGEEGERFTINSDNFTISSKIEKDDSMNVVALNIPNQDYIHNGKKATFPLDHATRKLAVGTHMAHMNHLILVKTYFDFKEHGLRSEDVENQDRQNWASAQRKLFPRVQKCLKKLEKGESSSGRKEDVLGTRMYLYVFYMYIEIFFSLKLTLYERVQYASTVANFLRIWRSWIYHSPSHSLKENFITMQCYTDVIISCHAAVLHIRAGRIFTPSEEMILSKTGSNCCEDYFSSNGSFVMNRHTYRFADMVETLPKMNRVNEIRADPDAPTVPKGHKKQIDIWDEGNETPIHKPDLKDYPTDDQLIEAWDSGISRAQKLCSDVGMAPQTTVSTEEQRRKYFWFFYPHQLTAQQQKKIEDAMCDDNDDDYDEKGKNLESDTDDDVDDTDIAIDSVQRIMEAEEDEGGQYSEQHPQPTLTQHSLKISMPDGKSIHKTTLVSHLNNHPDGKISKDRLTRVASVRNTSHETTPDIEINHPRQLSLNCDVAYQRRTDGRSNFLLGRIQCIVKSGKSRVKIGYKKPST